ncbi:SpoIID/LytB domain-containing protein [Angustibacter luteus]|uniref:SpoIID/LytB domain-containing protein n=1 Tax=Angustibacter luteus TaxID=658456 RepID=A0ABW1JHQ6_9ACTN
MRRPALALALTGALVAGLFAATPAQAASATWAWPSSGSLAVDGYGWGHGHGMSQYGAYGAAKKGLTYQQIMAFYYPGTTLATQTEPTMRVLVDADSDDVVEVARSSGLGAVTDHGTIADLPPSIGGATVTRWRAVRTASGTRLQYLTGTWKTATVGGATDHSFVQFSPGTSGTVLLVLGGALREYRGSIRAVQTGSSPNQLTVVYSTTTNYLRSVVPSEMPSSWSTEALRSQAVAARSYALNDRASKPAGALYDTCSTTSCQVFSGVAAYTLGGTLTRGYEAATSNSAVSATAGRVVTYGGKPAFTQFSASNGGWTTAGSASTPYLKAFADPYDGAGTSGDPHHWTDTITASALQANYPAIGTLRSVTVTRDGHGTGGGRVTQVVLIGSSSSKTLTGSQFASAAGLKSVWWVPSNGGWSTYNAIVGPGHWNAGTTDDVLARDTSGRLWLHAGNGAGGYDPRTVVGTGFQVFNGLVAPGDWDGDGHPDLLTRRTDGSLWLYSGNGTGGFKAWRKVGTGWGSFNLILGVGDWDGNGHRDLVTRRTDGSLWLYSGNGTGGFTGWRRIGTGFGAFNAIVAPGAWDADSHPDLLTRRTDGSLWLYSGNGTGGFTGWRQVGTGWTGYAISAAGDATGDGKADLVGRSSGGSAWLYPGTGTGGFRARITIGTP